MSKRRSPQEPPGLGGYSPVEIIELPNTLKPGDPVPPPAEFIRPAPPETNGETTDEGVSYPTSFSSGPFKPVPPRSKRRRRLERMLHRIARLPEDDRLLLEMAFFRSMSVKQVAKVYGVRPKEVLIRYGEIMERLGRPSRSRFPRPPGASRPTPDPSPNPS